jgi:hypothetical protein
MGDYYQSIVDIEASVHEALALSIKVRNWLIEAGIVEGMMTKCVLSYDRMGFRPGKNYLQVVDTSFTQTFIPDINGMEMIIGRNVIYPLNQGETVVKCAVCQTEVDSSEWTQAITEWYEEQPSSLSCAHCQSAISVSDLIFEPQWGFGNLGFKFWNWQPIKDSFIAKIGELLGHKVVFVNGKL